MSLSVAPTVATCLLAFYCRLKRVLFCGKDKNAPISYQKMNELIKALLKNNDVATSKVVHAMRFGSAQLMEMMG